MTRSSITSTINTQITVFFDYSEPKLNVASVYLKVVGDCPRLEGRDITEYVSVSALQRLKEECLESLEKAS